MLTTLLVYSLHSWLLLDALTQESSLLNPWPWNAIVPHPALHPYTITWRLYHLHRMVRLYSYNLLYLYLYTQSTQHTVNCY